MGVTFSFPMNQHSLADATLRSMGKGFAITDGTDLASSLLKGYERGGGSDSPAIKIVAITNDSVSTLISFIYSYQETASKRGAMGLIVGTGTNATVPLKLRCLHENKRQQEISAGPGQDTDNKELKIAVNTEWSINGSAPPLRKLGLITPWDEQLDSVSLLHGFQPLEYMTAGRYLGELGRIIFVDYLTKSTGLDLDSLFKSLPKKVLQSYYLDTTWLSHYKPSEASLLHQLRTKFPDAETSFKWTEGMAEALYQVAKAIEIRAAGIVAAGIVGLLRLAEDIPAPGRRIVDGEAPASVRVLGVGYTGGCIVNFQDYLRDTQTFLDDIINTDFGGQPPVKVTLTPCHDGGIIGAGILCAAASL
jgi:hexokinase